MTGIICVNKPPEITSFKAVSKVRGIIGEKKAGHMGTLDPMARGVLPIALGGATRFINYIPDNDKSYRASFILGKATDTQDITGTVISQHSVDCSDDEVNEAVNGFLGKSKQIPPMYSAKSQNGVRLYELARKGIEVERTACDIEIKHIKLLGHSGSEYTMELTCTKGTYVRSIIDDIGKKLGCGAVMTALCRTAACGFSIEQCVSLDELQDRKNNSGDFSDLVIPLEAALNSYKKITVSPAQSKRFSNGGALDAERLKAKLENGRIYRIYSPQNEFLGLGKFEQTQLVCEKILSCNI